MTKLQPVRGTHDILPEEFEKFHTVVTLARERAERYGFREMTTPIFEPTEVFARSLGDTSDIVHKEMFTFETKGGESVTLRPEFTASIVRAFISNGMQQHLPLKLFSVGPLFRYERPQKGRQRQFHQVNFEWLGDASPQADIQLISMAGQLLYYLAGKDACTLRINTLGDLESRARYREALVSYLTPYASELSEDSKHRLTANPLRILDSKDPGDQKITQNAPSITPYLSKDAEQHFDTVCESVIGDNKLPAMQKGCVTPSLVRGLDYYTGTVFEFVATTGELGAQNTVLAGGRYDGLIEKMGGKSTPAIGFAAGIERLILLMNNYQFIKVPYIRVMVLPFEGVASRDGIMAIGMVRIALDELKQSSTKKMQVTADISFQGNFSKRLGRAAQNGATHVVILAPEELNRGVWKLKNMATGQEEEIENKEGAVLFDRLKCYFENYLNQSVKN